MWLGANSTVTGAMVSVTSGAGPAWPPAGRAAATAPIRNGEAADAAAAPPSLRKLRRCIPKLPQRQGGTAAFSVALAHPILGPAVAFVIRLFGVDPPQIAAVAVAGDQVVHGHHRGQHGMILIVVLMHA